MENENLDLELQFVYSNTNSKLEENFVIISVLCEGKNQRSPFFDSLENAFETNANINFEEFFGLLFTKKYDCLFFFFTKIVLP